MNLSYKSLNISLNVTNIIRSIRSEKPTPLTIASTLTGTLFLLIFSIIKKTTLPPSKAGKGSKLIKPTFIDKYAVKYSKLLNPDFDSSDITVYIPTGPDKSFTEALPLNNCLI